MKVQILEYDEDKEMTLEILGEGHTFANIIREFLCDVKDVDSAGYYKEHPFVNKAKLVIKAAPKKKIDKAVRTACRDLTKNVDDFYKLLEKTA
ncbi:MAG: hypothetical protein KGD59_13790 [Candidatus Heimdallarchaeota archaeon]|jgi:DNA-directed RNA polymerase subunit L|nr:hypothetical protein [Candidatus Heimdallarchaeota archaeon]MBY8995617.1 hypothetical protein [Candidatus Heimdallarchaeota archaeon]